MIADIILLSLSGWLAAAAPLVLARFGRVNAAYVVALIEFALSILLAAQFSTYARLAIVPFWAGLMATLLALAIFAPLEFRKDSEA